MIQGFKRKIWGVLVRLQHRWGYFKLLCRDVYDSYVGGKSGAVMTQWGFKMVGSRSQHHLAMQEGEFELGEIAVLGKLLEEMDVFVDVGANIGYFTCFARNLGVKVVAIEPMQRNFQYLCENVHVNGWDDVELFACGLSDQCGVGVMYGASSTGASFIEKWAGASSRFKRFAAMTTLDRLIGGEYLGNKRLIKMDIEGLEYHALKGAKRVLEGGRRDTEKNEGGMPVWLVEITMNEYHPEGVNPCFLSTFELFFEAGYRCLLLDDEAEEVNVEMVKLWVKEGETGRYEVNYLFVEAARFEEVVGKIKSIEYQVG